MKVSISVALGISPEQHHHGAMSTHGSLLQDCKRDMHTQLPAGAINPLAPLAYPLADAASGLRQLSAARAIGKVRSSSWRCFGRVACSADFCTASPDVSSTYVAAAAAGSGVGLG